MRAEAFVAGSTIAFNRESTGEVCDGTTFGPRLGVH